MNKELIRTLFPTIEEDIPAKDLTTFGVGGVCAFVLRVHTNNELVKIITLMHKHNISYYILGDGSNVVFSDGVVEKVCIVIETKTLTCDGNIITCDAGVPLETLIDYAISNALSGLESLSGIPGSCGGAVVGNAGAYGRSISDTIVKIYIFDGKSPRWISKSDAEFSYRRSIFKEKSWIVLQTVFECIPGDRKVLMKTRKDIISARMKKYAPGLLCPGSFFKNILVKEVEQEILEKIDSSKTIGGKIPSGYLLEEAGACGKREGGIEVATFHGNLLFNTGEGTYADVCKLSDELKKLVWEKFGIKLCEEVQFMV
tara:strand:- start:1344 stop:2285 length:942 start_codon:yes stop_codon:yes gene_type:complete